MLPKTFYESLPYLYIAAGSYCMMALDGALPWFSGLLLYAAGALVWVARASHRRRYNRRFPTAEYHDAPKQRGDAIDRYQQSYQLPERLYEYLPFGYILAGYVSYQYYVLISNSYLALVAIILFTASGVCAWIMREYYRGYHRPLLPSENNGR